MCMLSLLYEKKGKLPLQILKVKNFDMASGLCLTQYLSQAQIWTTSLIGQHSEGHDALQFKHEYMYIP